MSSVTTPAAAVRARLPVPPPLTNSSAVTSRTASTIWGRRRRMSRSEADCMRRIERASQGAAGDPVADPGDLALVGHHAGQAGARALLDLGRHLARPLRSSHRRALGADPRQLPAQRPPADVQVEADADLGRAAPDRRLDQVEVRRAVDHRHRRARWLGDGQLDQLRERLAVGGRVGDDDVLEALTGEPQRLGQRERRGCPGTRGRARGCGAGPRPSAPTSRRCGSACRRPGRA